MSHGFPSVSRNDVSINAGSCGWRLPCTSRRLTCPDNIYRNLHHVVPSGVFMVPVLGSGQCRFFVFRPPSNDACLDCASTRTTDLYHTSVEHLAAVDTRRRLTLKCHLADTHTSSIMALVNTFNNVIILEASRYFVHHLYTIASNFADLNTIVVLQCQHLQSRLSVSQLNKGNKFANCNQRNNCHSPVQKVYARIPLPIQIVVPAADVDWDFLITLSALVAENRRGNFLCAEHQT